ADEDYFLAVPGFDDPVDQEPVPANMAIAAVGPLTSERMVRVFWRQGRAPLNEELHHMLQLLHRITAASFEALPVLTELLCRPAFSWCACPGWHWSGPSLCRSARGPAELPVSRPGWWRSVHGGPRKASLSPPRPGE